MLETKYIDAIKSIIKSEGLTPDDITGVVSSLSQCASSTRLIRIYMANAPKFRDMRYSYEQGK